MSNILNYAFKSKVFLCFTHQSGPVKAAGVQQHTSHSRTTHPIRLLEFLILSSCWFTKCVPCGADPPYATEEIKEK